MKLVLSSHHANAGVSPPAWGRGLKHPHAAPASARSASPPAWGRGLKLVEHAGDEGLLGRPPRGGVD